MRDRQSGHRQQLLRRAQPVLQLRQPLQVRARQVRLVGVGGAADAVLQVLPVRVLILFAAAFLSASRAAQPPPHAPAAGVPATVWERTYRSGTEEYELRFAAPAGDAVWLVVGARAKGQLGGDQQ